MKKLSPITLIVIILGIPAILYFWKAISKNNTPYKITDEIPTSISAPKQITIPEIKQKSISITRTFPHELLPGFNITIPTNWVITGVKQFGEKDSVEFSSSYFSNISQQQSMAFRIFKNGVFFDLIFDLILDDSPKCSDTTNYLDIGKGWYRVEDEDGYMYSKSLYFNGSPIGTNKKYKVCIPSGSIFLSSPTKIVSPYGDGALMLENIRIYGNPKPEDLDQIDNIIRSISGLK